MPDSVATSAGAWPLDPEVTFLNHGSFGSCPTPVLEAQQELRARIERQPVHFMERLLEGLLDETRSEVGALVGANPEDLAFLANATMGVNTVLTCLAFSPGDELVVTDQAYNACRNALDHHAQRTGAQVVVAKVPFFLRDPEQIVEAVLAVVTPRTRLALLDHITSPTALVFPMGRLVRELESRGIETLIDGAHAPGMVPVDLRTLGATYYTANFHKWCCAPKGAGMLYVRRDRQSRIRPLVISHGANSPRRDRSRFRLEFDWTGTHDASAILSVPAALRYLNGLLPGGLPALMAKNHALAVAARSMLASRLGVATPCPEGMLGSMASLPLPDGPPGSAEALHAILRQRWNIEVPVFAWPCETKRVLRVSAQIYNHGDQYERLAEALTAELADEATSARAAAH